jgi:hypothetical protein
MEMRNQELSEAPGGNIEGYENQENLEKGEQLSKPQQNKNILHETFSDLNESDNYSTKQTSNKTNKAYSAFLLRPLALSFNDISISQIKFDDHHHLVKITPETKFADSLENIGIKTRKVSLELFINPAFVFGKSTGTEFTEDHISNRNKNESPILTLGFGSDIKYHFSNWFIQTGLNFSQYGEKANYQLNRQVSDPDNLVSSIDTTFRWIYDPPNIGELWIVSIDTNWDHGQKTVYWEQKSTNRISYIEIPVLAGYQWNFDKINIDVSTGISLGFAISKTGGLPSPTNSELIQLGGINIAEPLINYIFQAGVAIPLRERLTLLIKPNLKYNLNSIYDDEEYTVKQHYNSFGLKVGVIIDL